MTKIVRLDPLNPDLNVIKEVADIVRNGGLCAFPTETVYGLGADAFNPKAITKVYEVKGRPKDNPLILHIDSLKMFNELTSDVPEIAYMIASKLWPGPITLILKKSNLVPNEVTANLPTVAIRCPAHPIALKLISSLGRPVAAPSANISGKPSPTKAEHVIRDLMGLVDVIIDGGDTFFGIESTIIDLTVNPPVLLRPGPITPEDITRILGIEVIVPPVARGYEEAKVALSPGVKYRHYSPNTPLILIELDNYEDLVKLANIVLNKALELRIKGYNVAVVASSETLNHYRSKGFPVINLGSRNNLFEVAHNLFKALREVDELGVDIALVEGFNDNVGLGIAIMNRLRKAASERLCY